MGGVQGGWVGLLGGDPPTPQEDSLSLVQYLSHNLGLSPPSGDPELLEALKKSPRFFGLN